MAQTELRHVDCWIFDLDNTLYAPSANLFSQIDRRMTEFIRRELGVERAEADRIRSEYWRSHGTTMAGMREHHGTEPERFLTETHAIEYSGLQHDPALADAIEALPGRRVIQTNGPRCHANAVLDALGYRELFDAVFALEDAGYVSKPNAEAFELMYRKAGIDPSRSAMIEDDQRNLLVPSTKLVRAIWLDHHASDAPPDHVDHHINDLTAFLRSVT